MLPLFSTSALPAQSRFRAWREVLFERLVPIEIERLDDRPFEGRLDVAAVGNLNISRLSQDSLRCETTPNTVRNHERSGMAVVVFKLAGVSTAEQDGRSSIQRPGDIVVLDHRPSVMTTSAGSQSLFLEVPREVLESVLGPTRLYTALTLDAGLGSTTLTTTFFRQLIEVGGDLGPAAAERMSAIGVDLIVGSLAERLARAVPRSVHGNATVQRAKAHVEANLGDSSLDPPQLAAAVGVSLRRLQELFHERGRHISDYIWERRLEAAARRLADPACAHLSIGMLAFGCGFQSQAHFARRFKDRYGLTPREQRQAAFEGVP